MEIKYERSFMDMLNAEEAIVNSINVKMSNISALTADINERLIPRLDTCPEYFRETYEEDIARTTTKIKSIEAEIETDRAELKKVREAMYNWMMEAKNG